MATPRCDYSDLPVDQCGHCMGIDLPDEKPIRWAGSETEARFPGRCAHCGKRFDVGALIVCADLRGDGASDEWCIYEHTREPGGAFA